MRDSISFSGSWIGTVTADGFLRVPGDLRKRIRQMSLEFFATSLTGKNARLYAMDSWQRVVSRLSLLPSRDPARMKFLERTDYYGNETVLDKDGVALSSLLCEHAKLNSDVIILGVQSNDTHYLEVYNLDHLNQIIKENQSAQAGVSNRWINTDLPKGSILASLNLPKEDELIESFNACCREITKFVAAHPKAILDVKPRMFEAIIGEVMKSFGFDVELTTQTRDGGADIIALNRDKLGIQTRYLVECKRWKKRKVSVEFVRALYGVKELKKADHAVFVTTGRFTRDAYALAKTGKARNLTLVDYEKLQEWFKEYLRSIT